MADAKYAATVKVPLVDLHAQYESIAPDIRTAIDRVLNSTAFIMGPEVTQFEAAFAKYARATHAIGVSSGTDALHLALKAVGVEFGDEVVTTPFTFIATAEAISMAGAKPVFCDIDESLNLDPSKIERVITPRTKVIMPVHLYGQPAALGPIVEIARKHSLSVIEDAAQAHGAEYRGKPVGSYGDVACFSFYPGKNLGAYGDAGAVTTNSDAIAERVKMLRDHGRRDKYEHLIRGFGNRLDALQAAILGAKLPHLARWTEQRRELAAAYNAALKPLKVQVPHVAPDANPVWHIYAIRSTRRDDLKKALAARGISTGIHYPIPVHLQPAYSDLGYHEGDFPAAEAAAREVLSLPLYPEMDRAVIKVVADAIAAA